MRIFLKTVSFMLVLLMLMSVLPGCGTSSKVEKKEEVGKKEEAGKGEAVKKETEKVIVVGLDGEIITFDPAMHRSRRTETVLRNIFDGLVTRTTDMKIVPELAESWEIPSPTEYIFKLRKGVKFHNGDDFTADDVVFTFERMLKEGAIGGQSSPRKSLLGPLTKVEKIDDYTVKFILSEPWPVFLKMLPHHLIVPKKYIEEKGDEYFAKHPVGTGPFYFVEGNLTEQVVLKRFDDYYGGSPDIPPVGPAKVDKVVFKMIPEVSSRIAALKSGEVHIIQSVPPHLVDQLKSDPNVVVKDCIGTRVFYVSLNVKKPPFDDIRVRKAIALAIDSESLVKEIKGDYGVVVAGAMLPNTFGKNTDLKPYPYDPEEAKRLLKEAGQENLTLVIDTEATLKDMAEAVAAQLKQVGINASVRIWEWGVLKPKLLEGSRAVLLSDWGNSTLDPFDILNPKFKTGGRGNYSHYSNPELDSLLDKAAIELDEQKRADLYRQAEKIIYDSYQWVFAYGNKEIEAASKRIKNWEPSPDGRINLHDVDIE